MNIASKAVGVASTTTSTAVGAAGALGGAAVGGLWGAARGTATGVRSGARLGVQSTPAAALTLVVVGAVGIVEWPVVLTVGGAALVVRELVRSNNSAEANEPGGKSSTAQRSSRSSKSRPAAKSTSKSPRKTAAKRTGTKSGNRSRAAR
ncbi:hypothetical protein [Rhodococcus sp. NPDC058521]|uniref:hypothetical protein n=1 Tax=Rhodococcus sp. NPDC058521 TaxID=3346536 RepID=UPI0036529327